ncbi:MAG: hypothetical protein COC05_06975 [Gammaproteobacteria bacterium]|nr:MAG: hypothetical protein COC05_06975 [Gammaproteobacteria bacterium]
MSNEQYPTVLNDIKLSDSTEAILKKNLLCELGHLGIIEIHGEDSRQFLHGQFTNDVEALAEHSLQLNGYCDPKGRLIGLFYLIRLPDKYLMLIDQAIASNVLKRLQMFVLMAEVEFEISALHCIGFVQHNPKKTPDLIADAALKPLTVSTNDDSYLLTMLGGKTARYIAIGNDSQLVQVWNTLSKDNVACNNSVWRLLDIHLGIPSLIEKTQGAFIPQMANLDLVDGLSFSKGCYPGQEVVARMHHLGKVKRRMYRLHITCEEQPLAGDGIYNAENDSNESVGKIVSAVKIGDSEFEALAILQIKHHIDKDLYLDDGDETKLELLSLPYKIKES